MLWGSIQFLVVIELRPSVLGWFLARDNPQLLEDPQFLAT
jgi:hypothetical protein